MSLYPKFFLYTLYKSISKHNMGNYLPTPNQSKKSLNGQINNLKYGICGMQGWRTSMEDSHVVHSFPYLNCVKGPACLFGVYDGHGGSHVSKYVARYIASEFEKVEIDSFGDFEEAIKSVYLNIDDSLKKHSTQSELDDLICGKNRLSRNADSLDHFTSPLLKMSPSSQEIVYNHSNEIQTESPVIVPNSFETQKTIVLQTKSLESPVVSKDSSFSVETLNKNTEDNSLDHMHYSLTCNGKSNINGLSEDMSKSKRKFVSSFFSWISKDRNIFKSGKVNSMKFPSVYSKSSETNESCTLKRQLRKVVKEPNKKCSDNKQLLSESTLRVCDKASTNSTSMGNSSWNFSGLKSLSLKWMKYVFPWGRDSYSLETCLASYSGCTALSVIITANKIIVVNAGDSRCVLSRNRIAVDLSIDHKPCSASERTRIYKAGGSLKMGRVNGNLNLSRSIGDLFYKNNLTLRPEDQMVTCIPDIVDLNITDNDEFLIIGCDGIWESFSSQDVVNFISDRIYKCNKLSDVLENLFDELLSPNPIISEIGCDNMTAILIDLRGNSCSSKISL